MGLQRTKPWAGQRGRKWQRAPYAGAGTDSVAQSGPCSDERLQVAQDALGTWGLEESATGATCGAETTRMRSFSTVPSSGSVQKPQQSSSQAPLRRGKPGRRHEGGWPVLASTVTGGDVDPGPGASGTRLQVEMWGEPRRPLRVPPASSQPGWTAIRGGLRLRGGSAHCGWPQGWPSCQRRCRPHLEKPS